jgi:hypothetical protein
MKEKDIYDKMFDDWYNLKMMRKYKANFEYYIKETLPRMIFEEIDALATKGVEFGMSRDGYEKIKDKFLCNNDTKPKPL